MRRLSALLAALVLAFGLGTVAAPAVAANTASISHGGCGAIYVYGIKHNGLYGYAEIRGGTGAVFRSVRSFYFKNNDGGWIRTNGTWSNRLAGWTWIYPGPGVDKSNGYCWA